MEDRVIPNSAMKWLARHFGKRIEWNGPTIYGVGYVWCGKIWFET